MALSEGGFGAGLLSHEVLVYRHIPTRYNTNQNPGIMQGGKKT